MLIESALLFGFGWLLGKGGWGEKKAGKLSSAPWPQEGQLPPAPSSAAHTETVKKQVLLDAANRRVEVADAMAREPGLSEQERVRRQVLADAARMDRDMAAAMAGKK